MRMRVALGVVFATLLPLWAGAPVPADRKPADAGAWPLGRGNPQSTGAVLENLPDRLRERWVFKCKDSVEGAPAVVDGVVFVASTDKYLYALDAATGKEFWKKKLGIMKASPAVRGGRVVVGSVDGKVHCVDAKTGEAAWVFDNDSGEIASGCNFHGDNVLVAAQGMPVICLNPKGQKVWAFDIDGGSNGTPTVVGDACFACGCDSHFHALDAKTGAELWKVEIPGQSASTSAVADGVAYLGTMTNKVVAIDLAARKKLWQFEPTKKPQAFFSSAAVADGLVVIGGRDRKVYAFDAKSGAVKWTAEAEAAVDSSPAVAGGRAYVGCLSFTGEFYALDLKTGKVAQQLDLDGPVTGSAAVAGGCLFVGTEKGSVYCFGK